MNKHTHIVLHHTVGNSGQSVTQALPSINQAHKNRSFPLSSLGYYIGYHYIIDMFGNVKQTRLDTDIGAHCREENMNYNAIGISCIGNFMHDELTKEQKQALIELIRTKMTQYSIEAKNVHKHQDFKATACPGTNIIKEFDSIVEEASKPVEEAIVLAEWEQDALDWAGETEFIRDPHKAPFDIHQVAWLAETNRKQEARLLELFNQQKDE